MAQAVPATLPIYRDTIETLLPHRYPFLLVDEVLEIDQGQRIVAVKHISANEPVLVGHFPGNPVYPGVYIVEGLAQAAGILGQFSDKVRDGSIVFLTEIGEARFRRVVGPGDVLRYVVTLDRHRHPFFWFCGQAFCGDELVAQAKISAKMP